MANLCEEALPALTSVTAIALSLLARCACGAAAIQVTPLLTGWFLGQPSRSSYRFLMEAVQLTAEVEMPPCCLYDERFAWFRPS